MNKKIFLNSLAILAIFSFTACSSKKEAYTPKKLEVECTIQGEKAPAWVCGSYEEKDRFVAVGSAPFSKLGHNFTRNEAVLNAKANLVNKIKANLQTNADSYMRSAGLKEQEEVEKVVTTVTKQTSNMTLSDSKQISYWQSEKDNSIFVLVAIDKESVNSYVANSFKKAVANEIQIRNSEDALNNIQ